MDQSRTELLIGNEGIKKLSRTHVAIFGLGGVGGYALEALVRAGVGNLYIVDYDTVHESNLNRQIITDSNNIGRLKVDISKERILSINPAANVIISKTRILKDNIETLIPDNIKYAIDAIDELESKISLIAALHKKGISFISSMGAGNKLEPTDIKIADISKTNYCPLARKVRKTLKEYNIYKGVTCVYSEERAVKIKKEGSEKTKLGSISYVPGIFGLTAAGELINTILKESI